MISNEYEAQHLVKVGSMKDFDESGVGCWQHAFAGFACSIIIIHQYHLFASPQAVSTLLRFDKEEEKLVTDHLNYKVSWFGSKPSLKKLKSAKVRDVL